eukprot:601019-Pyramimonas_sp.AAC.1
MNVTIPSGSVPGGTAGHEPEPRPQSAVGPGPSKPTPRTRDEVASQLDEDDSDDDGLRGVVVDDAPVVPGGGDPRRDSQPDDDPNKKLGLARAECIGSTPRSKVPGPGQLLARTAQNLDTMGYYKDKRIVAGPNKEELTGNLPLKGRRTFGSMRTYATGYNGSISCPVLLSLACAPVGGSTWAMRSDEERWGNSEWREADSLALSIQVHVLLFSET